MEIRELDPMADRAEVVALFQQAADFVALIEGVEPGPRQAEDFFADVPPGGDLGRSQKLGLFEGRLLGIVDLAFGFPEPEDAFLGLMLLTPEARGRGLGPVFLAEVEARARAEGAPRLLLGVVDENRRGRAFWERMGFRRCLTRPDVPVGEKIHTIHRLEKPLS